jgi:hybrid cluster-associated redox disulfide protein
MRQRPGLEDLSVKEIMDRWPGTASAFIARRMHCVGCPIGPFHTMAEAAAEHRLDTDALQAAVENQIRADQASGHRR